MGQGRHNENARAGLKAQSVPAHALKMKARTFGTFSRTIDGSKDLMFTLN